MTPTNQRLSQAVGPNAGSDHADIALDGEMRCWLPELGWEPVAADLTGLHRMHNAVRGAGVVSFGDDGTTGTGQHH